MILFICDICEKDENECFIFNNTKEDLAEFLERHLIKPSDKNIELLKDNLNYYDIYVKHICEECLLKELNNLKNRNILEG